MGPRSSFGLFGSTVLVAACANDFDSSRTPPPRGTLGEEMFGVICDRVGAQALREDLTGASFQRVCHRGPDGQYADTVDQTLLIPLVDGALDPSGNPVPLTEQQRWRARAVGRVETLGRRRFDLIAALDTAIPDVKVAIKDIDNPDPLRSCGAPAASGEGRLHEELANMLARFTDLYDDGTIPNSTEALGRVMNAFKASPDAQAAYARFDARQGYRPLALALGTTRPIVAYPGMRDLANATLSLLGEDGAARKEFSKLLEVLHEELRDAKADPAVVALPAKLVTDPSGRVVLPRPRTSSEITLEVLTAQNDAFGGGPSRFIAQRDPRGYAVVPLVNGLLPAPFVDKDADGLPDVDSLGRFVTSDGTTPPSPFFAMGSPNASRDEYGRALNAQNAPIYGTLDFTRTFAAKLLGDLKPLVDATPGAKHETLMYALAGARVILGDRGTGSVRQYSPNPGLVDDWAITHPGEASPAGLGTAPVTVSYDGFNTDTSALLDFVYATSQLLADKSADDTLAFSRAMVADHAPDLARAIGDILFIKTEIADKHPEATLPPKSVLWDEMIDFVVQVSKEPGLLEDVLAAMASDDVLPLGTIFASYINFNDHISYDRQNLNGPTFNFTTNDHSEMKTPVDRNKPRTGVNRSAFQRFVQTIHDTNGVTVCNKDNAVVHARGVQLLGNSDICAGGILLPTCGGVGTRPFKECEIFKIDNVGAFYLDAIVGKANLYFRPDVLRNGVIGIGASTVDVIQQSSGIIGFYDPPDSKTFRPKPEWLNRLVFFDQKNDSPNSGDINYITNRFLRDLQGDQIGTSVCPERIIDDPVPNAPDASPDKKVHGLRACGNGDWFNQRDQDVTFIWENFGFYKAIAPLASAFSNHKRQDLFLGLMEILHKHWADASASPSECRLGFDKNKMPVDCTRDGVVSYEPLLAEMFATDLLPALHDLTKILTTVKVKHCTAIDPTNRACTAVTEIDGIKVMAESTRAAVDPDRAKAGGLTDRHGAVTSARNDGTTNPQVTPIYLVLQALSAFDARFAAYVEPNGEDRRAQWKTARSQLVDQFLDVTGKNTPNASFANPALPKILPVVLDVLRAELGQRCPTSFVPPYATCAWARTDLTATMEKSMKGPAFAAIVDLVDAIRRNDDARTQIETLVGYLLDFASQNEALASVLASLQDMVQAMRDDADMIPLLHVGAVAAAPSLKDTQGRVVQKGLIDAQLAMLTRLNGRARDDKGNEICAKETDPNQILPLMLAKLVTPTNANGQLGPTPLEVIMDVIADVNRFDPGSPAKLDAADFGNIADNVSDFLLNKERGMEQLYAIVRNGTQH